MLIQNWSLQLSNLNGAIVVIKVALCAHVILYFLISTTTYKYISASVILLSTYPERDFVYSVPFCARDYPRPLSFSLSLSLFSSHSFLPSNFPHYFYAPADVDEGDNTHNPFAIATSEGKNIRRREHHDREKQKRER